VADFPRVAAMRKECGPGEEPHPNMNGRFTLLRLIRDQAL